ncbi:UBN2_3 domain-containing protein, partial [Cephalotus follicularis]
SLRRTPNNYLLWGAQILPLIESKDMQGFLDGGYEMPKASIATFDNNTTDEYNEVQNPSYIAWRRSGCLFRRWITSTLSKEVLGIIDGLVMAQDVWRALEETFAQDSKERGFDL